MRSSGLCAAEAEARIFFVRMVRDQDLLYPRPASRRNAIDGVIKPQIVIAVHCGKKYSSIRSRPIADCAIFPHRRRRRHLGRAALQQRANRGYTLPEENNAQLRPPENTARSAAPGWKTYRPGKMLTTSGSNFRPVISHVSPVRSGGQRIGSSQSASDGLDASSPPGTPAVRLRKTWPRPTMRFFHAGHSQALLPDGGPDLGPIFRPRRALADRPPSPPSACASAWLLRTQIFGCSSVDTIIRFLARSLRPATHAGAASSRTHRPWASRVHHSRIPRPVAVSAIIASRVGGGAKIPQTSWARSLMRR